MGTGVKQGRILVIDERGFSASSVVAAVERAGYEIAGIAATLEEAERAAIKMCPDLAIMIADEDAPDAESVSARLGIPVIPVFTGKGVVFASDTSSDRFAQLVMPPNPADLQTAIELKLYKASVERELGRARQAAEAADRAKTSFLATISHELRTPMNGVLGMTELLLLSDLGEPYRENVVLIKDSALSLLSVLNQIIDYSKLETSSLKVREMDFRIEDLLTGVLSQYRRNAEAKGVKLAYSLDPVVPGWLRGDSDKIRQVLGNLVNNAVKFTPSGQVIIDVAPVEGDAGQGDGDGMTVRVSVQDTGVGIDQQRIGNIFESFSLVEDHLCHGTGGLGLGLAIVNRLLIMLGGTIRCESEAGQGSLFSFEVPVKKSRYETVSPLAEIGEGGKPLDGARVLIAEDDFVNQRYIMRLLEKMGCAVTLVEDGQQAVDALRGAAYDIVLMDVEMPVMDGIEATRVIRRPDTGCLAPDIPIVALTAHAMWGDEQRCLHAGMTDYVTKPVDVDTVAAIIRATLDSQ